MIITITGYEGAGKTTVAKMLPAMLTAQLGTPFEYISVGDIRRAAAAERGMSIAEFNAEAERLSAQGDYSLDEFADKYTIKMGQERDNFVAEGRLCWYFLKDNERAVNFLIDADETIRAERIIAAGRKVEQYADVNDAIQGMRDKRGSDALRYRQAYGIEDYLAEKNFNHVIDSTYLGPTDVAQSIIDLSLETLQLR